jgi:hypothetical protein
MGNSLIIGSTSQLSHYFPKSFHRISSRDVNIEIIRNGKYECVYILFSEQRTFLNENEDFFIDINVRYTMSLINDIKDYVDNIVVYSTSELWNNYDGKVSVDDKYDYNIDYTKIHHYRHLHHHTHHHYHYYEHYIH